MNNGPEGIAPHRVEVELATIKRLRQRQQYGLARRRYARLLERIRDQMKLEEL